MTLKEATDRLTRAGVSDARYDARALFAHVLGLSPSELLDPFCDYTSDALEAAISRRESREPLQYIIGEVGFYRESYIVTPDVLIPRADTECLVDFAVRNIPEGESFLDLCTGSGCIAISTLKNTRGTTAEAVDISKAALGVARQNAERNGVSERLSFTHADVMDYSPTGSFYAVLSNPPYVKDDVYQTLDAEIFAEPKAAFVGGDDGGDFYRRLVPLAKSLIKPEGFIALEIGYDQSELIEGLSREWGLNLEIIRDLGGNPRCAVLRKV